MSNTKNWPYDWNKPDKDLNTVLNEIVEHLPFYACDVANCKDPQEVGMSDSLYTGFQVYYKLTKEYFENAVQNSTIPSKNELITNWF